MAADAAAPVRVAMWSGPRNISTAMMRAFEARGDTVVVDEPFYACYLAASGVRHPLHEAVLESQSQDWAAVADQLTAPLPAGTRVHYQKHMTHHMIGAMDFDWCDGFRHAFLIRDPREIVASYQQKRDTVTAADLGLARQRELYDQFARDADGALPVVLASDVLKQPQTMLRALCAALGLPYTDSMLRWPAGLRETDGVWAPHWYHAVAASTGFAPYRQSDLVLDALGERVAAACRDDYEYLLARRLRA